MKKGPVWAIFCLLVLLSTAGVVLAASPPRLGLGLPTVTLPDLAGHKHTLTADGTQPCALFFFCGCAPCHETARLWSLVQQNGDLDPQRAGHHPATIIVFTGDEGSARTFVAQTGLDLSQTLILTDPNDQIGQKFGVIQCPRVFVADAAHRLRYTNPDAGDPSPRLTPTALVSRTLTVWRRLPAEKPTASKKAIR